jgi:hypothetical protein
MARLTLARKIAAITLIVWKNMPTPRLCRQPFGKQRLGGARVAPRVGIVRGFPERPAGGHEGGIALV